MIVGVFANFTGSMIKAGMAVKSFFRLITGQRSLAYVTTDELEASAAANSLATAAERAAGGMMAEAKAASIAYFTTRGSNRCTEWCCRYK